MKKLFLLLPHFCKFLVQLLSPQRKYARYIGLIFAFNSFSWGYKMKILQKNLAKNVQDSNELFMKAFSQALFLISPEMWSWKDIKRNQPIISMNNPLVLIKSCKMIILLDFFTVSVSCTFQSWFVCMLVSLFFQCISAPCDIFNALSYFMSDQLPKLEPPRAGNNKKLLIFEGDRTRKKKLFLFEFSNMSFWWLSGLNGSGRQTEKSDNLSKTKSSRRWNWHSSQTQFLNNKSTTRTFHSKHPENYFSQCKNKVICSLIRIL